MTSLFIGLRVPGDVRDALQGALGPVWGEGHDLAWTRPSGWHLTLAHLGETSLTTSEVAGVLAVACEGVVTPLLTVAETATWFDRALVLAVADDPAGWCDRLGGRLRDGLANAGEGVEQRTVRPHVTLARLRGRGRGADRVGPDGPSITGLDLPTWRPTAIEVFESVTGDGPARYPVLAAIPLPEIC